MIEIHPVLHTASLDVHPESKTRIIQLANREAVGIWQRHGDVHHRWREPRVLEEVYETLGGDEDHEGWVGSRSTLRRGPVWFGDEKFLVSNSR